MIILLVDLQSVVHTITAELSSFSSNSQQTSTEHTLAGQNLESLNYWG